MVGYLREAEILSSKWARPSNPEDVRQVPSSSLYYRNNIKVAAGFMRARRRYVKRIGALSRSSDQLVDSHHIVPLSLALSVRLSVRPSVCLSGEASDAPRGISLLTPATTYSEPPHGEHTLDVSARRLGNSK